MFLFIKYNKLTIIPKGITPNQLIKFSNQKYNLNIPQLMNGHKVIRINCQAYLFATHNFITYLYANKIFLLTSDIFNNSWENISCIIRTISLSRGDEERELLKKKQLKE